MDTQRAVPKTAREMLAVLDTFLTRRDNESKLVASILSALRGPDGSGVGKRASTMLIRSAAFPGLWNKGLPRALHVAYTPYVWGMLEAGDEELEQGFEADNESYHFMEHAEGAANSLQEIGLLDKNGRIPGTPHTEGE